MLPYWLLFSVFSTGAIQYTTDYRARIQGGPVLHAMGAALMQMVGLSYEVGGDWTTYVEMLQKVGFLGGAWNQDPGYTLLNRLAFAAGLDIWFVNLVCAGIFTWGLLRFARRQPNPWLVVSVAIPYLVIVVAMGYTRQAVAIGFILAGLTVLDRGLVRFVFYLACAAAFHKSAVVVLPLVAFSEPRRRLATTAILVVSAMLLYYAFVQASIDLMVTNYVEYAYASQGAGIRVAMNIPPAVIFLLFSRRFFVDERERRVWRNFSIGAIIALMMLMFTEATTAVDRLALYIIPLQMVVLARLPFVFSGTGGPSFGLTILIIAYSAAIQFVWLNFAANAPSWLPYQFYPLAET